jgi:hypothetical protein
VVQGDEMKKDVYITIYTKEQGKLEFTEDEWNKFDVGSITYHREDGPAKEWADGAKEWFLNDKHHRIDGPAMEWNNGPKYWYIDGKSVHEHIHAIIARLLVHYPSELKLTDPEEWIREMK